MNFRFLIFTLALFISGCTNLIQQNAEMTPMAPAASHEPGFEYFQYKTLSDYYYQVDTQEGENKRLAMIGDWLEMNGYPRDQYEIISRKAYQVADYDPWEYNIFYFLKVPTKPHKF